MVAQQARTIAESWPAAEQDFHLVRRTDWTPAHRQYLAQVLQTEVLPVLTPLAVEELNPRPLLPGLKLFVALLWVDTSTADASGRKVVVIPVPGALQPLREHPFGQGHIHLRRLKT